MEPIGTVLDHRDHPDELWERMWAPYDPETYRAALRFIRPEDVVLDIGAGDLRFSQMAARRSRKVYAVEVERSLAHRSTAFPDRSIDGNLFVFYADARRWPFPKDITLGVLLMRHCSSFSLYTDKLITAGATRLITNARWRTGVELVDLRADRLSYPDIDLGWYACRCGKTGFKPGPAHKLTEYVLEKVNEVATCPHCESLFLFPT